jgi:hypothetical protein
MNWSRLRLPTQRARVPLAGGLFFVAAYSILFIAIGRSQVATETTFQSTGTAQPLYLYAELTSVNAARGTAQIKFSFANDRGEHGTRFSGIPDRDLIIDVSDGDTERRMLYRAGEPMPVLDFAADADGSIETYPVDRYKTALYVRAYEGQKPDVTHVIPLNLTVSESLDDWDASVTEQADAPGMNLTVRLHRSPPIVFFGIVVYLAMALIAAASLTIGTLVFLRSRRLEATFTGALAGMLFALPAMRAALPGAPPLGVAADVLIFLWAEIAVAAGLSLFVWRWARGESPS